MENRFRFRAWDKKLRKYINLDGLRISDYADYPDQFIVEQCTGLKDENGKLIYEGDVVEYRDDIALVGFLPFIASFGFTCQNQCFTDYAGDIGRWGEETVLCEIIGNIHENRELVKKELLDD